MTDYCLLDTSIEIEEVIKKKPKNKTRTYWKKNSLGEKQSSSQWMKGEMERKNGGGQEGKRSTSRGGRGMSVCISAK